MNYLFCILVTMLNLTYSPDSTRYAYTADGNLYVHEVASGTDSQLTFDGSDAILNGRASWVYYEEIFGRPSKYKAFWWSPDSKKLAFYRFDQTDVPVFPIYLSDGQDGKLNNTRYPKVGETNPSVRIGFVDFDKSEGIVWADFEDTPEQYFGTPFWGADSQELFVQWEPRVQNQLKLFRVNAADGSKKLVYEESSDTWLDWIEGMLFAEKGLYMARSFESGWEQIYFLSYDGKTLKKLTDGPNWRVYLRKYDSKKGDVYFIAQRDSRVHSGFYKLSKKGKITRLSPEAYNVDWAWFSRDMKNVYCKLSNARTKPFEWSTRAPGSLAPEEDSLHMALPRVVSIKASDGQDMFALMTLPLGFDPSKKYPVHFEIYGGPNTSYVYDRWRRPEQWFSENGIIHIVADCRAAGHNGRWGTDLVFKDLTTVPVEDFVTWAEWAKSLPYVDGEHMGVEGFSFGGTMTAMLLIRHPELFCCGIAGGGVYDWIIYDSHYTERFMLTPALNPDGFERAKTLAYVEQLSDKVALKLTHGTGDDNVHFQNTLQLVDAFQQAGKQFELMIYPGGMHGYRGKQGEHSTEADRIFWLRHLKNQ